MAQCCPWGCEDHEGRALPCLGQNHPEWSSGGHGEQPGAAKETLTSNTSFQVGFRFLWMVLLRKCCRPMLTLA